MGTSDTAAAHHLGRGTSHRTLGRQPGPSPCSELRGRTAASAGRARPHVGEDPSQWEKTLSCSLALPPHEPDPLQRRDGLPEKADLTPTRPVGQWWAHRRAPRPRQSLHTWRALCLGAPVRVPVSLAPSHLRLPFVGEETTANVTQRAQGHSSSGRATTSSSHVLQTFPMKRPSS